MLLKDDYTLQYLNAFKNDKIEKGIGIKCLLDNNFVYKKGNFNIYLFLYYLFLML